MIAMNDADHRQFLIGNYAPPSLEIVRGEGSKLWDANGEEYLDFTSGIAVSTLGHGNPRWVEALTRQAGKLAHCSNLFSIPEQVRLAKRLVSRIGPGRMLFCNSGAEANEGLIKLARLAGSKAGGPLEGKTRILVAENGFHGRTMGALSATESSKYRKGFEPLLKGFDFAPLNDLPAFEEKIGDETVAVLVESIQGEGGIREAEDEFLQELQKICREKQVLLMLDEVQSGIGRTGDFLGYQKAGISPDAVALAKGLGGGFPIGAFWVAESWSDLFQPGSHGTTFGGSPLACSAAHAVLDVIEEEGLVESVREKGCVLKEGLSRLAENYPELVSNARGRGFMLALVMTEDPGKFIEALRKEGLLVVAAAGNCVRFLPPLTSDLTEIEKALQVTEAVLKILQTKPRA